MRLGVKQLCKQAALGPLQANGRVSFRYCPRFAMYANDEGASLPMTRARDVSPAGLWLAANTHDLQAPAGPVVGGHVALLRNSSCASVRPGRFILLLATGSGRLQSSCGECHANGVQGRT